MIFRIPQRTKTKFVQCLDDLDSVEKGDTLILAGELVLLSETQEGHLTQGFVRQPNRKSILFGKNKPVKVWIRKEAFQKIKKIPKVRITAAIDYITRIGLLKSKQTLICTGGLCNNSLFVNIIEFNRHRVIDIAERRFDTGNIEAFKENIAVFLTDLRKQYPKAQIQWHEPLPEIPDHILSQNGVSNNSNWLYKMPVLTAVEGGKPKDTVRTQISMLCLFMLFTSILAGIYIYIGWSEYRNQIEQFQTVIEGYEEPFEKGTKNNALSLLELKKFYLKSTISHERKLIFLSYFLNSLSSLNNVAIQSLHLQFQQRTSENARHSGINKNKKTPDLETIIHVPIDRNSNALHQAKVLLTKVSEDVGTPLWVPRFHKKRMPNVFPPDRVVYTIHGNINSSGVELLPDANIVNVIPSQGWSQNQ